MVGHAGTGESDVANGGIVAVDDEQGLALAGGVGDHHARASAGNGQVVAAPDRAVVVIARVDGDGVAVLRGLGGGAGRAEGVAGTDLERRCLGGGGEQGGGEEDQEGGQALSRAMAAA